MSDDDEDRPLEPDLIDVLERMREKGHLAVDSAFAALRHMANIGEIMHEVETSFRLGVTPDPSLAEDCRMELSRQIDEEVLKLRHLCEAAAMVPELRRRFEAHGHAKEIPFGPFLQFVTKDAGMRTAEGIDINYIEAAAKAQRDKEAGRPTTPPKGDTSGKPWTLRDARRYQDILLQWPRLEEALRWNREQPTSAVDHINLTQAKRLISLYERRDKLPKKPPLLSPNFDEDAFIAQIEGNMRRRLKARGYIGDALETKLEEVKKDCTNPSALNWPDIWAAFSTNDPDEGLHNLIRQLRAQSTTDNQRVFAESLIEYFEGLMKRK